ncbi:MAG: hypothetical protein ACFHXK_16305 [bacterium]
MNIEEIKKKTAFMPFPTTDFLNKTILMPIVAMMGKPKLLNKPSGPGVRPMPNIAGSLGISMNPNEIITEKQIARVHGALVGSDNATWHVHHLKFALKAIEVTGLSEAPTI